MKAMLGIILLSIFSANVAVFSITELCAKASNAATDGGRGNVADAELPYPRQRVRQWVNY